MDKLLSPVITVVGAFAACFICFGIGYGVGRSDGKSIAEKQVIETIVEQNERAGNEAETCRERFRQCLASDGLFDFADCSCVH